MGNETALDGRSCERHNRPAVHEANDNTEAQPVDWRPPLPTTLNHQRNRFGSRTCSSMAMALASSYDAICDEIQVIVRMTATRFRFLAPIRQQTPNFTIRSTGAIPWSLFVAHLEQKLSRGAV